MSTQTPTIGLTLPIGTEHVSRQIINDNMTKIDTAFGNMSRATMRDVPFAVAVADWTASGDDWVAEFATAYVTSTSKEFGFYDTDSMTQYAKAVIDLAKKPGGGAIVFTTSKKPTGTITGTLYVWDSDDGKIPVIIENTVVPIENGGTNASNLVGAKQNLGIADCESDINTLSEAITNVSSSSVSMDTTVVNSVNTNIVQKCGKLVILNLQFNFKTSPTVGTAYTVGQIPSGYRPASNFETYGLGAGSSWKETDLATVNINSNGNIIVTERRTAQNNWVKIYVPYFT